MSDQANPDGDLSAVPLFAGLSRRQRRKLFDASRTVKHESGHEVTAEGEGALALHLVLSGRAAVSVGGVPVRTLGPGEYFGEISLIDGRPRSATVTADTELTTLAVPHLAFHRMLDEDPSAAREVLVGLCARLREIEAERPLPG
jgi:CRP-like cAMP-binding protein